jgi:hypothetical protein
MASSVNQRVQKRRDALRAQGLRPVQIWVPDVNAPGFAEECARQARLVAAADAADPTIESFMEAAWLDIVADIEASEK